MKMEIMNLLGSNAMEQALQNPLILSEIFKNRAAEGKSLRLVCKLWDDIVLSQPQPKLCLNLNPSNQYICCDSQHFQTFCSIMNPKLARSIKLDYTTCPTPGQIGSRRHAHEISTETKAEKLLHVCTEFGQLVQLMDLDGGEGEELIPTLYKIFQNLYPNLMELDIGASDREGRFDQGQQQFANIPFLHWPNLHKISIHRVMSANYRQLSQLLLNLRSMKLFHDFYPDLSVNTTLRSLSLQDYLPEDFTGFSFDVISTMLEQVKNHLEVLEFVCYEACYYLTSEEDFNVNGKPELTFKLPVMPNLKHFRNDFIDVFTCGDSFQDIGCERLKSLRSLKFQKNYNKNTSVDGLLANISTCNNLFSTRSGSSGVTKLEIMDVREPKFLSTLKTPFPLLKNLDIYTLGDNNPTLELGSTLEACSTLGLEHLKFCIPSYPNRVSEVIKCLANNAEWFKALKTLDISCCLVGGEDEDDSTESDIEILKQVLISMAGMVGARILFVAFCEERAEAIYSFIKAYKLPVELTTRYRKKDLSK